MANEKNRTVPHEKCYICGFDNEHALEEHHIIPRSLGGSDHESNMEVLCSNCHTAISNMYGRWFFRNVWEIFEQLDHPPDLVKKNPPKGLKYNSENRLVPDRSDGFDKVVDAFHLLEGNRELGDTEISRRTGLAATTVSELHENYGDYKRHLPDEDEVSDLSNWFED
jgi:hypothetical protein